MKRIHPITWFDKSTIQHLRIPFSFLLLPVFLLALSQATNINWQNTFLVFIVFHFLLYPSSNGYNSYQDRDETSIGGLKNPAKVSENLYYVTLLMDLTGILCGLLISFRFAVLVLILILISRVYSYRKLRLKKYPVIGFLTVSIFQGAFVFLTVAASISPFSFRQFFTLENILCMSVASLFIGSSYPLSQIYQHEADKNDGVISISYKLGYMGTFIFSAILFSIATILLIMYFNLKHQSFASVLFLILMIPVVSQLVLWFNKVYKSTSNANYDNTMSMNILISICMNLYFVILILNNFWKWF